MQFSKIKYVVIFILLSSCSNKNILFKDVKKHKNINQVFLLKKNGFFGVKESITYNKLQYNRFIYVDQGNIVIDGFFCKDNDFILFIPYRSVYQNCKLEPLLFCKINNKESHYLGYSCLIKETFNVKTTVTVSYDTIKSIENEIYFSHNMLSDDDILAPGNAYLETRNYMINLKTGLESTDTIAIFNSTNGLYWWNY